MELYTEFKWLIPEFHGNKRRRTFQYRSFASAFSFCSLGSERRSDKMIRTPKLADRHAPLATRKLSGLIEVCDVHLLLDVVGVDQIRVVLIFIPLGSLLLVPFLLLHLAPLCTGELRPRRRCRLFLRGFLLRLLFRLFFGAFFLDALTASVSQNKSAIAIRRSACAIRDR